MNQEPGNCLQREERYLARRERQEQEQRGVQGHETCGHCGHLEPVDRNREFMYPCPRRANEAEAVPRHDAAPALSPGLEPGGCGGAGSRRVA